MINRKKLEDIPFASDYAQDSLESNILQVMFNSDAVYAYNSLPELAFELDFRHEIIAAADLLDQSDFNFKVFRESTCNPQFWDRMPDGGFRLKKDIKPSDAIRDIYKNSALYGTECATAMVIIYYKAMLSLILDQDFDRIFSDIYLMNWHQIANEFAEVGLMRPSKDFLPGDRGYFDNPDVNPVTPEWQGENVINMANGIYYGHGIGKFPADVFIKSLNQNRIEGADESAYLLETVARPDFKKLYNIYSKIHSQAVS